MLAGPMTVIDNVVLGDRRQAWILHRRRAEQRLRELGQELGLGVDPRERIENLSVGQQQRVEILKALFRDVKLLILDEPTAVLTPQQTAQLFVAVERLRDAGKTIVFISHKLAEVKRVWEGPAASVSAAELSLQMVGHEVEPVGLSRQADAPPPPRDAGTLSLQNVCAGMLRDVNLEVHSGEIVGIAGVDGNGQQDLAEVVVGLRAIRAGRQEIAGTDVTALPLGSSRRPAVAHIPTDRRSQGLVPTMSIAENLLLKDHARAPYARAGCIDWGQVRRMAGNLMTQFDIRAEGPQTTIGQLSGGNQQKVILARELAMSRPQWIVAVNPARGLDIAATGFVHRQLLSRRAAGCGILLISSEWEELFALCDRVAVLYGGRLTMSRFPQDGAVEIGRMMTGAQDDKVTR
jgi:simple sugar transport system ATP-binding protein